jgi:hypothetical protein
VDQANRAVKAAEAAQRAAAAERAVLEAARVWAKAKECHQGALAARRGAKQLGKVVAEREQELLKAALAYFVAVRPPAE